MEVAGVAFWERYPSHYRANEVRLILRAVEAGESCAVLGLSGSGKSNLLKFLAGRDQEIASHIDFVSVDCNRMRAKSLAEFYRVAVEVLEGSLPTNGDPGMEGLARALDRRVESGGRVLCLLFDRFDILIDLGDETIWNHLRALRDEHKYSLAYVTVSRRPLPAQNELAELFYGHTFWLGPLSKEDAIWSAQEYAQRAGRQWDADQIASILHLSGCYPSFLRAVCQAAMEGSQLSLSALLAHPAVQAPMEEFWADRPSEEMLTKSGLLENPLLAGSRPAAPVPPDLTAKEKRLLDALQARPGQICEKDELICAVWPEDQVYGKGLRDDSLAQLVRRLREKIEPDPAHPRQILTVPGRGYRYR
jgi:energy-coupling factor transporter ATP-binding protein EcfA2